MSKLIQKILNKYYIILVCLLFFIWTLPNTIALRNIVFFVGFLISCAYIFVNFNLLRKINYIPFLFLFLLFLWVLFHYLFFSIDPKLQYIELTGLWLRTFLAVIIGFGFAIYLFRNDTYLYLICIFIGSNVLFNIFNYIINSIIEYRFLKPGELMGKPFYKIETVFWGSILISYCCSTILYFIKSDIFNFKNHSIYFIAIILALISAFISSSKNGIAVSFILLLLFTISVKKFKNEILISKIKYLVFFLLLSISIIGFFHVKTSTGWNSLINDVTIGLQVEKFDNWKNPSKGSPFGVVSPSTYDRVAWGIYGLTLINKYPFGFGLVNQSFESWLKYLEVDHNTSRQSHSGWIDFGLAFGYPGIIFLWIVIYYIIIKSFTNTNNLPSYPFWITLTIFILGLISEIFYKQFFEALMFWIGFSLMYVSLPTKSKSLEVN